jgi:hypothetical protein
VAGQDLTVAAVEAAVEEVIVAVEGGGRGLLRLILSASDLII